MPKDGKEKKIIYIPMPTQEPDAGIKAQIKDLFQQDKDMSKDISAIETRLDNHKELITEIGATNKNIETYMKEGNLALFGDEKQGIEGLVKENKAQTKSIDHIEKWILRVVSAAAGIFAILKLIPMIEKVFN